jgi:adenosylcobinamide-GDP ribazoletransferase
MFIFDSNRFNIKSFLKAVALITRIPVPDKTFEGDQSNLPIDWAYPLIGLLLALPIYLTGLLLLSLRFDSGLVAATTVVFLIMSTGAMHEDGLADTVDGFWGGWDKENRLKIMKDSHVGTYGIIALIFSILIRWYCIKLSIDQNLFFVAIVTSCTLSRSFMTFYMWTTPCAKEVGLSANTGRPDDVSTTIAFLIGLITTILLLGIKSVAVLALCFVVLWSAKTISTKKINGQTGDTIGAVQQICEVCILCAITVLW